MSNEEVSMQGNARCEVCGKSEDRCIELHLGGERHVFDSFEGAIRGLMPVSPLCGNILQSPGIELGKRLYCSYACASVAWKM